MERMVRSLDGASWEQGFDVVMNFLLTIFPRRHTIVLPEEPPTPLLELILAQFKDQLVLILLGSAAVSFVLAVFEGGEGWTAFVDPAVVRISMQASDLEQH